MTDQPEPHEPTPAEPTPHGAPGEQLQPEGTPVPQESPAAPQGSTPLDRTPSLPYFYPPVAAAHPTPAGEDGSASVVTHTYDAFGRLTGSTTHAPLGHVVTYTYDFQGNRLEPPAPLP